MDDDDAIQIQGSVRGPRSKDRSLPWPDDQPQIATIATYRGRTVEALWLTVGGRLEPVAVKIWGGAKPDLYGAAVTGELVRRLPLGRILAESRRYLPTTVGRWPAGIESVEGMTPEITQAVIEVRGPQRGRELSRDELQRVADVYRAAWKVDEPVNKAVRDAFHLSKDGAAKRISKARKAGLLNDVGRTQ